MLTCAGSTAGVYFLRSLLFWIGQSGTLWTDRLESDQRRSLSEHSRLNCAVITRQVTDNLVNSYFSAYHLCYPFVHEATFRTQLDEAHLRPQRTSWHMLLHTIMALGVLCLDKADGELDDQLYHRALSFSEDKSLLGGADLTFVQALVLLSNLAQKRNKPNTGSNFLGLAARMAISLGLHRELPNWKIGPLQREIRRRVWWGLYMFDSGASTTFGRPVLLPGEEAMDVYPVRNIHDKVVIFE